MRLADYCVQFLADNGVRDVFLVSGGGAMHLNDAVGREGRLRYFCNHHEQASSMAAEGYARTTGKPGVVIVTAGPGAINALNGVFGAYTDSIPMLVLSGQAKRETLLATHGLRGRLRQLGDQEADIERIAESVTKSVVTVRDPRQIRVELEKAWHLCQSGRPGPCWLDIPVDVQATDINAEELSPSTVDKNQFEMSSDDLKAAIVGVVDRIRGAKRPVLLAGTGVRIAGAVPLFREVVELLKIPVATAWTHDIMLSDSRFACGKAGTIGDRAGNFTVQNSDLLLVIGSRLNIRQVSYNWGNFARRAHKIVVDVDPAELSKPMVVPDWPICCDAFRFLEALRDHLRSSQGSSQHYEWVQWCRSRVEKYPVFDPSRHVSTPNQINPYHFAHELFQHLDDDDVIACGDATACIVTFQSAVIKQNTRLFSNSGSASMGHDLPAAIGAAIARDGKRVICLAGDGSVQMNIQELQTVAHHRLPIKLFILNNGGYLSIRQTQSNFFNLAVGAGPESGVSFPDFVRVAEAFGLPACRLDGPDVGNGIQRVLDTPGPAVCEVMLDQRQGFEPKLTSRRLPDGTMVASPLEDMAPFLDREELKQNSLHCD